MASLGHLTPGHVGLAIVYALQTSNYLSILTGLLADLEMQMNAVERVKYYTDLQTETVEGWFVCLRETHLGPDGTRLEQSLS